MAKLFKFEANDSLEVVETGAGVGEEARWSMTAEQAVRHEAMFRPEMGDADRARLDAVKAKNPRSTSQ